MNVIKRKFSYIFILLSLTFFSCVSSAQLGRYYFYQLAVNRASVINLDNLDDEIKPLVTIKNPKDKMVTWNATGDKVLMLTWHHFPDSYKTGMDVELTWGEGWTFTDKEIKAWYKEHGADYSNIEDWVLRMEQLLGISPNKSHTHITAYWCRPQDVLRPAYNPDITKQISEKDLDGSALGELKDWFYSQKEWATKKTAWTGLGYSYDWFSPVDKPRVKKVYGLSEFIVKKGSVVKVEWTKTNKEFLEWLKSEKN